MESEPARVNGLKPLAFVSTKELDAALVLGIVGSVAAALYFFRLGAAPFVDPPEGLHATIAQEMNGLNEWVTPHMNGVRYFEKPPLPYWLMAAGFGVLGSIEWAARLWSALFAVGTAVLTAWLGTRIGSKRLGLFAGLMVAVNLEFFIMGRIVKPDTLFVFLILVSFTCFILYYQNGSRSALLGFYASLAATVLAKDILGALGPVMVLVLFFSFTRERNRMTWCFSWTGVGLFALIALPWYVVMEWKNPGFLWYTVVDKHLLGFFSARVFPDEDVPLTALQFLGITVLGFLPWSLGLPFALVRSFRQRVSGQESGIWFLLALWSVAVLATFTISQFKLPHYALPAFPHMALLVAKLWEDTIAWRTNAASVQLLLAPPVAVLTGLCIIFFAGWQGMLDWLQPVLLPIADLTSRNLAVQGQEVPFIPSDRLWPRLGVVALIFGLGTVGMAAAIKRGLASAGLGILFAVTALFLFVCADAFIAFAENRAPFSTIRVLKQTLLPEDLLVHEGALENSGSLVLALNRPIKIVNGKRSNLSFGSTFPEAKQVFWDTDLLKAAWAGPGRVFLVSIVRPNGSIVSEVPPTSVYFLDRSGRVRLYSNRPLAGPS